MRTIKICSACLETLKKNVGEDKLETLGKIYGEKLVEVQDPKECEFGSHAWLHAPKIPWR